MGSFRKHFRQWLKAGFFFNLWRTGTCECDEMEGIARKWQGIDGAMVKAPLAREAAGPNPTERGENGNARPLPGDGLGVPLSLIATGANRHDVTQWATVLDALVLARVRRAKGQPEKTPPRTSPEGPALVKELPARYAKLADSHEALSH
jgi:putative transposase